MSRRVQDLDPSTKQDLRAVIEQLIQVAQHAEYPEGDPPIIEAAKRVLQRIDSVDGRLCFWDRESSDEGW